MSKIITFVVFLVLSNFSYALTCPDPHTTSLQWGEIPPPWQANPFSPYPPQADDNTRFARANILVAGYGQGVMCTYAFTLGEYSIWWPVRTKIPARVDYHWIETLGGFVCTEGLDDCKFYVVKS